ncbi:glycine betaine ABC transporter substrate-binding protein [Proteiniclasticum sp. C24MP]|uniref:glycine betaine ABC transporter substrate-binding protein n=1 Tax=Proteiniclasticum sp. C24MP TaxID=3374101 RepID=UPI0037542A96
MKKKIIAAVIAVFTMSILASCGANETEGEVKNPDDAITLGSFVDTEGGILGNMILLALEDEGYLIDDKVQFGTPDVHRNALLQGELDLGVDYTGNGQFYSEGIEEDVWRDKDAGYDAIKVYDEENNDLIWMKPANANNTEALAVKREFAEANGLSTMEDFADYVNGGGEVKLITSQLFAEKESGLLGMEAGYGFELESDQLILLPHGNTAETLKALANGTDGVNVALAYGTDGSLADLDLVLLEDILSIPPVYEPSAIIRKEVLDKYPEIQEIVESVFGLLDKENLQQMNKEVIVDGLSPRDVAETFLKDNGILE